MRVLNATVAVSACTLLAMSAGADTIVGDLTWTAGSEVDVTDDLLIQGTLTVEEGVVVRVAAGLEIRVQAGGMLVVDADRASPATFQPAAAPGARWDGLVFEAGSDGVLTGAVLRGTGFAAVRIQDASPEFIDSEIFDVRSGAAGGPVHGILAFGSSSLTVDGCRIYDLVASSGANGAGGTGGTIATPGADGTSTSVNGKRGGDGGDGGDADHGGVGGDAYGIRLVDGPTASVRNTEMFAIRGGNGGAGGFGGSGSRGGNGGDGVAFVVVGDGGRGGDAGDGGLAGHGGHGGDAFALWSTNAAGLVAVDQNVIHTIVAGNGGKGGRAGFGGQGGTGGNGADTGLVAICGGDGGDAGIPGAESNGGRGGDAGKAAAVVIDNPAARARVTHNTIADIIQGARGDRGDRVNTTIPSFGGNGGTGGWPNFCEGSDGADRNDPNNSVVGPFGAFALAAGLSVSAPTQGVTAQVVNNVFSMGETVRSFAFEAAGSSIIASDSNLFDTDNFADFATGSGTASLGFAFVLGDPMFADRAAGDFRVTSGSIAIDAGDSTFTNQAGLTTDFDGNARVVDDPDAPNTGFFQPVDMGAFEFAVTPDCPADLDGNGLLDLTDVTTFVAAFTGNDLSVDFDGNGLLDLADITFFVTAFQAGCP